MIQPRKHHRLQFVPRRDRHAPRQLREAALAQQPRAGDRRVRMRGQAAHQRLDRARRRHGVRIHQQDVVAAAWRGCRCCWPWRIRGCRPRRSPAPTASRCARASAVPSVEALSTTVIVVGNGLGVADERLQARVDLLRRVVGDDDDREAVPIGHRRPPRGPTAWRRRRDPSRSGSARRRDGAARSDAASAFVSSSAIAAAMLVVRCRTARHSAPPAPQVSRATGVSSTTGGTPAASASSGVRPKPSYSERNANTDARS